MGSVSEIPILITSHEYLETCTFDGRESGLRLLLLRIEGIVAKDYVFHETKQCNFLRRQSRKNVQVGFAFTRTIAISNALTHKFESIATCVQNGFAL